MTAIYPSQNWVLVLSFLFFSSIGTAQESALIVRLDSDWTIERVLPLEKKIKQNVKQISARLNAYYLPASSPQQARLWHKKLSAHPSVLHVSYDEFLDFRLAPDDPFIDRQWSLEQIQALDTWDITTGGLSAQGDTVVVAVIDSGFDPRHPDLAANIWQNLSEIPFDGLDNDKNGYIDDQNGWNFVDDRPEQTLDWHGQSVLGIIGARGDNGIGVSGINWQVKMMLFSVRRVSHVVASFDYILEQRKKYNDSQGREGAFVVAVNNSLGLNNVFCDEQPVWRDMYDLLGAEGVLSVASPPNSNTDVDLAGDMPTTCPSDFLLTTLRTDREDQKHVNSGYGTLSIDMGSPGQNIYTTQLNDGYNDFSGTSASAPHLTGAIALLYSLPCPVLARQSLRNPADFAFQVKSALLEGVDQIPALVDYTLSGGRLNIKNSAALLMSNCSVEKEEVELLKLWPNPVGEYLNFNYRLATEKSGKCLIYDAFGRLIKSFALFSTGGLPGSERLNVSGLPAGLYVLSVQAGKQRAFVSFIVV